MSAVSVGSPGKLGLFSSPKEDVVAGLVVFLVAVPLCLGIAVACDVPPVCGVVAGIIGGLVVPLISRSPLSVSGPAAGLTSIVLLEVGKLGLRAFLTSVILAGALQVIFGLVRAGRFSLLVPSAVIRGMLAAIGITIVIKQVPVALGGSAWGSLLNDFHAGSATLAVVSFAVIVVMPLTALKRVTWLPPALIAVLLSVGLAAVFPAGTPFALMESHRVSVPLGGAVALFDALPRPDFSAVTHLEVWVSAITVALVASIESLLSLQAVDQLDPLRRRSPPERELIAQGVGNMVSGLLGGLPATSVIVRSGANVAAGGRQRLATMVHGALLLVSVLVAAQWLNLIPRACLAAVLIRVGLALAPPSLWRSQWKLGLDQFLPFALTVAAILATDLLKGVFAGIAIGIVFVLRQNARGAVSMTRGESGWVLRFHRDGTFVSKPALQAALDQVADGEKVVLDATGEYVDHDLKEVIAGFVGQASARRIDAQLVNLELKGIKAGGH